MALIKRLLAVAASALGFGIYVWIKAVLSTPAVKRRKARRRALSEPRPRRRRLLRSGPESRRTAEP